MSQSNQAFICDAIRTPFGRYGGALSPVRADDLGAVPIKALMERNPGVDWTAVADVLYGCANQAGEDNRNVARMSALLGIAVASKAALFWFAAATVAAGYVRPAKVSPTRPDVGAAVVPGIVSRWPTRMVARASRPLAATIPATVDRYVAASAETVSPRTTRWVTVGTAAAGEGAAGAAVAAATPGMVRVCPIRIVVRESRPLAATIASTVVPWERARAQTVSPRTTRWPTVVGCGTAGRAASGMVSTWPIRMVARSSSPFAVTICRTEVAVRRAMCETVSPGWTT